MNKYVCTILMLFTQAVSESVMSLFWVQKSVGFGVPCNRRLAILRKTFNATMEDCVCA